MAHSKKSKAGTDGKRKETREERRIRLEKQAEAREKCFAWLPYAGGVIVVVLLAFAFYVRSVPPAAPRTVVTTEESSRPVQISRDNAPEFMTVNTVSKAEAEAAAAAAAADGEESLGAPPAHGGTPEAEAASISTTDDAAGTGEASSEATEL